MGCKKSGSERVLSHFETKIEAIEYARKISRNQNSELFIHGKDGKIQNKDSNGNDPKDIEG